MTEAPRVPSWPLGVLLAAPLAATTMLYHDSLRALLLFVAAGGFAAWVLRTGTLPRSPGAWAAAGFIAAVLVALTGSRNPWLASRQAGMWIAAAVIFAALASSPRLRADLLRRAPRPVAWVAGVVSAVGLLQHLGWSLAPVWGSFSEAPASIFGHSNYGGTFAALLLPWVLLCGSRADSVDRRRGWGFLVLLLVTYLLISRSRAGLVGALAAAAVWLLGCWRRGERPTWAGLSSGILILAGAAALAFVPLSPDRGDSYQEHLVSSSNFRHRVLLWGETLDLWKESPWVGIGPGEYSARIWPHRRSEEYLHDATHGDWPLRVIDPHHTPLHVLAETGVPGVAGAAAMGIVAAAGLLGRRGRRSRVPWAFGAVVAAFLASGLFNTLDSQGGHVAYAALGAGWLGGDAGRASRLASRWAYSAAAAILLLFAAGGWMEVRYSAAQYCVVQANADPSSAGAWLERCYRMQPWAIGTRVQTATKSTDPSGRERELRRVLVVEPRNPVAWLNLGRSLVEQGRLNEAGVAYASALSILPDWSQAWIRWTEWTRLMEESLCAP